MRWLEISVETPTEAVETVSWLLSEFETGGVVIEDPALFSENLFSKTLVSRNSGSSGRPAAFTSGRPVVKWYLPVDENLQKRLVGIKKALSRVESSLVFSTREVAEEDWANAWKAYYQVRRVGRRMVIKPAWKDYETRPGDIIIEMDPGMAFGTGDHPTTVMCLEVLESCIKGGEKVYDVGTGSGILAIASARLGAGEVVAVDRDPVALKSAAENIALNGAGSKIKLVEGDLLKNFYSPALKKRAANIQAQVVVANIIAEAIINLVPAAAGVLSGGGIFIASGIIEERACEVRQELEAAAFEIIKTKQQGGWVCYAARRRF